MSCTTPGDVHDGAANPVLDVFGTARRHGRVVQPQARLVHQEHEQQPVIDMQETANQSMNSSGDPFRNSIASGRDPSIGTNSRTRPATMCFYTPVFQLPFVPFEEKMHDKPRKSETESDPEFFTKYN